MWCNVDEMADAELATRMRKGLYMGSVGAAKEPGYDFVVSAAEEWKLEPQRGVAFMHVPLRDKNWDFDRYPNELLALVDTAERIAERVRSGQRVLIFCNMGMNRSGLMTALTLMHLGSTPQSAIKAIRKRHPCTLSNESFVEAIKCARSRKMV